jgi:hypothetical protein
MALEWLGKFPEWLGLKPRLLFGVCLVAGLILFLPDSALEALGLSTLRGQHHTWLGLSFIGSSALLVSHLAGEAWTWFKSLYKERKLARIREAHLRELGPDEQGILVQYIANREKTRYFEFSDGVVNGLVTKKILYRASNMAAHFTTFPYNIQPWAWRYLLDHPEVLEGARNPGETKFNQLGYHGY